MNMLGTREAKDIIYMNNGIRICDVVCKVCKDGYKITQDGQEILKTSKINIALDWLVENQYLHETRFRLTAEQRSILRTRIWEYVGFTVIGGISLGIGIILAMAWLLGM